MHDYLVLTNKTGLELTLSVRKWTKIVSMKNLILEDGLDHPHKHRLPKCWKPRKVSQRTEIKPL